LRSGGIAPRILSLGTRVSFPLIDFNQLTDAIYNNDTGVHPTFLILRTVNNTNMVTMRTSEVATYCRSNEMWRNRAPGHSVHTRIINLLDTAVCAVAADVSPAT